jgi:predicted MPP superfamily phosphohydrolase
MDQQPVSRGLRALGWGVGLGAVAGLGTVAYSAGIEVRNFVVRRVSVAVLPSGHRPLKVLHVSDLHLTPSQGMKRRWLASLADLEPDLVVNTGDNLAHQASVGPVVEGFDGLLDRPGVFVFGSNDYFAPKVRNPIWYLFPDDGKRNTSTPKLPWQDLRAAFEQRGWTDLTNTRARLTVADTTIAFVGVDDPHLSYDDLDAVAGPAPADVDLRVGVAHAPYLRVLDQYAADGYDLTFAGHTHGGQVCLPVKGAIVTNCDLEPARAKGLHRHPADSRPGDPGSAWLHVSAGAGTSPYAPVRLCCRPEATLLTLLPKDS